MVFSIEAAIPMHSKIISYTLLTLIMEEVKGVEHPLKDHGVEDLESSTAW